MRKIKFRAWDKVGKKMFDVNRLSWQHLYGGGLGHPNVTVWMKSGGRLGPVGIHDPDVKRVVLMQFFGLKDKNGVEICDKDYVQFVKKPKDIELVSFPEDFLWLETQQKEYKVIGNKYENPRLKVKKQK